MTKTIAFIDNFDEVDIFFKTFKSHFDKETIYIASDALAYVAIKKKGIKCKAIDDYRNRKEWKEANNYALNLVEKWFIDLNGNDFTDFEGISLGRCLKKQVVPYFIHLLKAVIDVSNIIECEKPEKVLLLKEYLAPTELFGKNGLFLHKRIFQSLMKDKKYYVVFGENSSPETFLTFNNLLTQFHFEKQSIFAGKIVYYCPVFLNRFIKKVVVSIVDQGKRVLSKNKLGEISALTLSATDLKYFGSALIGSYLKKGNCYLYYFDGEKNCYFDSRIIRVSAGEIKSLKGNKKITEYIANLKSKFEGVINREKNNPHWTFRHISLVNFVDDYLREIIECKIPELIKFLIRAENTIKKSNINIVLISEMLGAKRIILAQVAKRHGLPALHIPHGVGVGFLNENKVYSHFIGDLNHFPFYATHEVSGFRYHKQMQEFQGIRQDQLILTGIPRFGKPKNKSREMFYEARKRLNLSQDDEIVLFNIGKIVKPYYDKLLRASDRTSFKKYNFYVSIFKLFKNRNNSKAVFKLKMHDVSTNWLINNIATENGKNNFLFFKDHLKDLLIAADAVVITKSNIGIEALYCDTPVIVYNDPDIPSMLPLCKEKTAIEIKSPEELTPALDKLRYDKSYKKQILEKQRDFLIRNLPSDNKSSAERISDIIIKLAEKN